MTGFNQVAWQNCCWPSGYGLQEESQENWSEFLIWRFGNSLRKGDTDSPQAEWKTVRYRELQRLMSLGAQERRGRRKSACHSYSIARNEIFISWFLLHASISLLLFSAKRSGHVKCQRNRYTYFPWTPGPFDFCSVVVSWNQAVLIRSVSCRPSCQGSNCDPSDLYQARAECKRKMKERTQARLSLKKKKNKKRRVPYFWDRDGTWPST